MKFSIFDFAIFDPADPEGSTYRKSAIANRKSRYLFSRCKRWQRQRRQYFLNSSLFGVFFLFFVVT
jgi:hypothetical protein